MACVPQHQVFAAEVVIKFATIGLNDIQHEYLREFKKRLEAASNGVSVELYPGAQLGSIADTVRGLQIGSVEMFLTPPDFLKGVEPRFQIASAPGLMENLSHAHRTLTNPAFRDPFLRVGEPKGIKGLNIHTAGGTDYATMLPVRKLADFNGLKIRVNASEIETRIMKSVGAAGIPMDMIDVQPALQNRVLDGLRSPAIIMAARKLWVTTKNLTILSDTYTANVHWVSMQFWRKQKPELQRNIERIAKELEPFLLERALALNVATYEDWRKNGVEVIRLPEREHKEFIARAAKITDDIMGRDPQLKELYGLLKKAAAEERQP
jgi:TRAP-type C4-dicarboxylate transport system substrate-binding protein